jgi:surface protein
VTLASGLTDGSDGSLQLYKLTHHCTMQTNEVTSTLVGEVCCSPAIVDTQAMIASQPSGHRHPTDRPIPVVVDLCLYCVVTDRCRGQELPFGVRQIIKDYAWVSFDNETLRAAVQLWCSDRATAYDRYGEINDWEVRKVTYMARLFTHTNFNDRIDRLDVRNVTSMEYMFDYATLFNQPLNSWDVRQVIDMRSMFSEAEGFNQPLSRWNVSQVTNMSNMFWGAFVFNQPLNAWDVGQVKNMNDMFSGAKVFNQPLDTWSLSNVPDMSYMFYRAWSFNQVAYTWRVSPGTNVSCMFESAGCRPYIQKIS